MFGHPSGGRFSDGAETGGQLTCPVGLEFSGVGYLSRSTIGQWHAMGALLMAMCFLAPACSTTQTPSRDETASQSVPVPPPAVSGIDNTVSVKIALADSFDVLQGDKCAGRSRNSGMRDGALVQLRGDTVGGSTSTTASAHVERRAPRIYRGKPLIDDDGIYCVVKAVFSPARPDPSSRYSIKFVDGDWLQDLVHVGRAPYGQLDRPGYGSGDVGIQRCPSLLDPPTKYCD